MTTPKKFPVMCARDLEKRDVMLPAAFTGERNVILIAFRRQHQALVDSWLPWLDEIARTDSRLRVYEVHAMGRQWLPLRAVIDGGLASAIGDPLILQRTCTVYGGVRRLTLPFQIHKRDSISLLLVNRRGEIEWGGSRRF